MPKTSTSASGKRPRMTATDWHHITSALELVAAGEWPWEGIEDLSPAGLRRALDKARRLSELAEGC